jgi:hypothetical protein
MRFSSFTTPKVLASILLIGGATVAAIAPGCSFTTNTTAIQCASEAECVALGPEFAGTTCDANTKTCIKVPEDSDLCKTNKECIDLAGGQPAICRKSNHKCVNLLSPECPRVMAQPGQLLNDDTIVVGAITPVAAIELGDVMDEALKLFQAEFTTKVKGLPGLNGSPNVRPLVIVACTEFAGGLTGSGYDEVVREATHLVKDIGVPVIIGPVDPAHTALVASLVTLQNRTLVIQPTGDNPYVNNLPSPTAPTPIIWSTSPNDRQYVQAAAELIAKQLEPQLNKDGVAKIKIATVADGTSYGTATAEAVEKLIKFNGKTAAENQTDGNYIRLSLGDSLDKVNNPAPAEQFAKAQGAVFGFKPNIIIDIYAPVTVTGAFYPLAFGWGDATQGAPFPYHVDLVATMGAFAPLFDVLSTVVPLQGKVFSFASHREADRIQAASEWVTKFKTAAPQFATSFTPFATKVQQWYDAGYLAAYAIAATGDKPLTGENLGKTIPLLNPPGMSIKVGTEDLPKALGILGSGQGIDLEGLSGNMNLDPADGTLKYDLDVTCPVLDPVTRKIVTFRPSGFYVPAATGQGVGTLACPQTK